MNWLRNWLYKDIADRLVELTLHTMHLEEELIKLRSDLTVTFRDEFDPKRKEMSERLGQKMIEKLKGEHLARLHTEGKL